MFATSSGAYTIAIDVKIDNLRHEQRYAFERLVVMSQPLSEASIRAFLEQCGVTITPEDTAALIQVGLSANVLTVAGSEHGAPSVYCLEDHARDSLSICLLYTSDAADE